MITVQCPKCKRTQRVIATRGPCTVTCNHGSTRTGPRDIAIMVRIPDTNQQESA